MATEDGRLPNWLPAMWASLCLHMILVGALQPASAPSENRFSQRAIEVTLEKAAAPPASPAAIPETDRESIRPWPAADAAANALSPDASDHRPRLEDMVTPLQPTATVTAHEFATAAPAAAPSMELGPQRPPQQKPIKPATPATSSAANQRQALQDYVLQVVAKLSHTRFYAASSAARNGDGVVIARLTVARDGGLVDLSLPKQSGSAGVDSSVLDAIRKAAPFAPLPKAFADNRFTFIVPINYAPER